MLYTLGSIRDLVSPFVLSGGSCPNATVVTDRVNEAIRRLLDSGRGDWVQTQRHVRITAQRGCVTLPREFSVARLVDIDCGPATIFPMHYRYVDNGPGYENAEEHYGTDLEDMGDGHPTFFDIPDCDEIGTVYLFAASPVLADASLTITVYGRKAGGVEVLRSTGIPGEDLKINTWSGGVEGTLNDYPGNLSTAAFTSISSLHLPAGRKGYVSLYAVNPDTHGMYFLGRYHPNETVPSYRRYRLLGADGTNAHTVDMLCRVRYIPASRDDDVLLLQNPDAIKTMIMAIREENAGNMQASMLLEGRAIQQLQGQLTSQRSGDPILRVQDNFAMGTTPNII